MSFTDLLDSIEEFYNQYTGAVWGIITLTALVSLLVFTGGKAVVNALEDHPLDGCLTSKGLVSYVAHDSCYDPSTKPTPKPEYAVNETPKKVLPLPVYNPPCGPGSDEHFCSAPVYKKIRIEGEIDTVEFNGDEPFVDNENHLEPDFTEVMYFPPEDDSEEQKAEFCGNVLDKFTPGKKIDMVVSVTKMSDYNGCYDITVTERTFGGKRVKPVRVIASVPGQ